MQGGEGPRPPRFPLAIGFPSPFANKNILYPPISFPRNAFPPAAIMHPHAQQLPQQIIYNGPPPLLPPRPRPNNASLLYQQQFLSSSSSSMTQYRFALSHYFQYGSQVSSLPLRMRVQPPPDTTISASRRIDAHSPRKKRQRSSPPLLMQIPMSPLPPRHREPEVSFRTGRWTHDEHRLFLHLTRAFGNSWAKISEKMKTRSESQVRSHAQKYYLSEMRIEKAMAEVAAEAAAEDSGLSSVDSNAFSKAAASSSDDEDNAIHDSSCRHDTGNLPKKLRRIENRANSTNIASSSPFNTSIDIEAQSHHRDCDDETATPRLTTTTCSNAAPQLGTQTQQHHSPEDLSAAYCLLCAASSR